MRRRKEATRGRMRTIKFRGKYIHGEEWLFGYFHRNNFGDCYISDGFGTSTAVDFKTVSQYVCTANNGEEIYEGDIVKNLDDNSIWHVCWSPNKMGFTVALVKPGESDDTDFEMRWLEDCVVIGNIWDSDERLLKEEEK